ncbi:Uncharacterised protein [Mycobacteroides abscessus]|nr:Uncharacterised protein [Mycobacteroides abscessus]
MSGRMRSVHAAWASKRSVRTRAGRHSGTAMRQNICQLFAPSRRAASNGSRGRPRKNCRSRNT